MELLRTATRADVDRLQPRGESQYIMLKPMDKKAVRVTVTIDDPQNFLKVNNGETITVILIRGYA